MKGRSLASVLVTWNWFLLQRMLRNIRLNFISSSPILTWNRSAFVNNNSGIDSSIYNYVYYIIVTDPHPCQWAWR